MRVVVDGEVVRKLRLLQRVTGAELARAVGITPAGLCHVEQGRRRTVKAEVFMALVRELDIAERPDWLCPPQEVKVPAPRREVSCELFRKPSGKVYCESGSGSGRTTAA